MRIEGSTLRDVALEAGVSIDTVSRVLNGKGKMKWASAIRRADEIKKIAERLNYRPNAAARAIRSSRTRMVGALVRNNPSNPYIHPVTFETILGINDGLEAAGYVLSVVRYNNVQSEAASESRVFREQLLEAVVAIGTLSEEVIGRIERLVPNCIWANTNVWREECCIRRDEVRVGEIAGQQLTDLGYKRLVILGGARASLPHYAHEERFAGISSVAKPRGVTVERVGIPWGPHLDPATFPLDRLEPGTAIVAESMEWAHWVVNLAGTVGKVPVRDFGLASLDASGEVSRYWPALSRVTYDYYSMGLEAARMVLQRLEDPETTCVSRKFTGEWIAGNTASGPREAKG